MSRATFSARGRLSGSISYSETQVTSSYTGSSASSIGSELIGRETCARCTACSAIRTASSVSATPAANPQVPSWITRTARPRSSSSLALSSTPSRSEMDSDRIRSSRNSANVAPRSLTLQRGGGQFVAGQGEE